MSDRTNHPRTGLRFYNENLAQRVLACRTAEDFQALLRWLEQAGTFSFPSYRTGLFPAVGRGSLREESSGYTHVWVRDNIHVAHALWRTGQARPARRVGLQLARYFRAHVGRFRGIIAGRTDFQDPMQRPHIRFNGKTLKELPVTWSHAQNDAMGYFLWFYCLLLNQGLIKAKDIDRGLLSLFVLYFRTIRYWRDQDSGHWEEIRKIAASSIGVVVAGLQQLHQALVAGKIRLTKERYLDRVQITDIQKLIHQGQTALQQILPAECVQAHKKKRRLYDAASLFLAYPLQVVEPENARCILTTVTQHLQGEVGIKRYLGDSYWAADFRARVLDSDRTAHFGTQQDKRDTLHRRGKEAQWCIFDPIVSVIYARQYQSSGNRQDLKQQRRYLERSLAHITDDRGPYLGLRCPELYFLEAGRYVPNDHCPLLWTQANLLMALHEMIRSLKAC
jgi:hypothetical protein